jgi:hypothetical protein
MNTIWNIPGNIKVVRRRSASAVRQNGEGENMSKKTSRVAETAAAQESKRVGQSEGSAWLKDATQRAKGRAERAAEEVKMAIEAEARAKKEVQKAREKARRAAEEFEDAAQAETRANREAKQAARGRARQGAKEAKGADRAVPADFYSGRVELAIASPVDPARLEEFRKALSQAKNIRLVVVGVSADEGTKTTAFVDKPIPLLGILREMPLVERAVKIGKRIGVTLKAGQRAL